jgi:peroxiredoxin
LKDIHKKGAQLVAISPELPDESLSLQEKMDLDFEVLTDLNNDFSKKLGIAFSMKEDLIELYKHFGIDLVEKHGNGDYVMPVPATFVVNRDGRLVLSHIGIDYTKRMEPKEVLKYL